MEHPFRPALVGRSAEMESLRSHLGRALEGNGSAVLVSGEAGIGKSRLCEEILAEAKSNGAAVARGWCVEGTLEPLHPVREALASLKLESVLDDSPPPELLGVYLLDKGGVMVANAMKSQGGVDADIFSGMLQAISNFAKDSLSQLGAGASSHLGSISYGDYRIVIRNSGGLSLASIIHGEENEPLLAEMDDILSEHAPGLRGWCGNVAETAVAAEALDSLVSSGRYAGRHLVSDPGLRKSGILSNILAALARKAAENPLVLYLDDLQWADPTTISAFHYLARNATGTRLMILGTFRPEDVVPADGRPHPLANAVKTMSREGVVSLVKLERFKTEGSRELVESALDGSTLEEAFYSRLQGEGGGNPFYTLELLRLMRESGALAADDNGRWRLARAVEALEIPGRIADIVGRRLDRMPPDDARLLSSAAVLGEEFTLDALAELTGIARMDLAGRLDSMESSTGLVRSGVAGYRFDHSKVREAAYVRMGLGMRRELHRLAAESLMRAGASGKLSEIALHMHSAGDPRAQVQLVVAARDAKGRFALEEAAKLYKLAAEHGPLGRDARQEFGDCERYLGQYDGAVAAYEGLLAESEGRERGILLINMAEVRNHQSNWTESLRLGGEACALLEPIGQSSEMARACHVMYHANMRRGSMKEAEAWALRQMDNARGSGDAAAVASAEHDIGTLFLQTRRFDDALLHLQAAVDGRRNLGDLMGLASTLNNIGAVYHNRGDWMKATVYYKEAIAVRRSIGDARGIASTASNLGIAANSQGDYRAAMRFMAESLGIRRRIGDLMGQSTTLNGMGMMWLEMHEFDKAEEALATSLEIADRVGEKLGAGVACANLGDLMLHAGKLAEASGFLERGIELGETLGDGIMLALCRLSLAEVEIAHGRPGEADAILALARRDVERLGSDDLIGAYHRTAGRLASVRGERAEAVANFEKSMEKYASLNKRFQLFATKRAFALFLRDIGDTDGARKLAREVIEFAKSSGAEKLAIAVEAEHAHLS